MNNFSYFSTVRTMFNNDLADGLTEARKVLGVSKAMVMTCLLYTSDAADD